MILYTIIDPNVIFKNEAFGEQQSSYNYCEMNVDGTMVQISQTSNANIRVERIISTNPSDFLNPKLQPGCIIPR